MVRFAATALALAVFLHGASVSGTELVLLDFWSPTCGPCMQMKPTVEAYINAQYPIKQIDVSRQQDVAQQYHVTGVPCFVMLVDGQEVDRVVGATTSDRLTEMFNRAKQVIASQRAKREQGFDVRGQSPDNQPAQRAAVEQPTLAGATSQGARPAMARGPTAAQTPDMNAAPEDATWTRQFDSKLLAASVRLNVEDEKALSHGTGTIIDMRQGEALIITCGHLFRESKGKGPLSVELFEATPQGARVVETVPGEVISFDLDRDVALVTIRTKHSVSVAPVAPSRTQVARGDRAASVGCSNGQDPTIMATRVTWLDRYQGPPNIETSGAPPVGRSGGGLFNDQGQLVGICFAADYEGNKGLYAGLDSIHDELKRLGLQDIYDKAVTSLAAGGTARGGAASDTIVRGQVDENAGTPAAAVPGGTAGRDGSAPLPEHLSDTENAALQEILSRATTSEVTCIIRPKDPSGKSEIITLDNVSPEFVKALAERQRSAAGLTVRK